MCAGFWHYVNTPFSPSLVLAFLLILYCISYSIFRVIPSVHLLTEPIARCQHFVTFPISFVFIYSNVHPFQCFPHFSSHPLPQQCSSILYIRFLFLSSLVLWGIWVCFVRKFDSSSTTPAVCVAGVYFNDTQHISSNVNVPVLTVYISLKHNKWGTARFYCLH